MKYKKSGFFHLLLLPIFIFLVICFLISYFLIIKYTIEENENQEYLNSGKKLKFIEEIKYKDGVYTVGILNLPSIGFEVVPKYIAICVDISEKCFSFNGIRVIDEYVFIYNSNGFVFNGVDDNNSFGIFTQDSQNFYSLNELKDLPQEQQNILLDLQKRPRFMYDE